MTREIPPSGVILLVNVDLLKPEEGGRTSPISSGYRPLCLIPRADGTEAVFGLCELYLDAAIPPGRSGQGRLAFATAIADDVRSLLVTGSRISLAEGSQPIGTAEVRGIE